MPIYQAAGLAMITLRRPGLDLTTEGQRAFFRVVGNDGTQGGGRATYLEVAEPTKVFVIDDGSAYGAGIDRRVVKKLGSALSARDKVQEKQTEFDAHRHQGQGRRRGLVFYGGYTTRGRLRS